MNTGDFELNVTGLAAELIYPPLILLISNSGLLLIWTFVYEEKENKIVWMMKLLGLSKKTDILYKVIMTALVTIPFALLVAFLASFMIVSGLSILANLVMVLVFILNMTLISLLITYCLSPVI